jgi:defect-in-organelle-trafficking protein DotC
MGVFRMTYIPGILAIAALSLSIAAALPSPAYAEAEKSDSSEVKTTPLPPTLQEIQEIEGYKEVKSGKTPLPVNIRLEALKEAALSYGARGGLAARSYEIRQELNTRASYLDKIFDFRRLLVSAPSGLLIEPPIISESLNALLIGKDGQSAAVSDAVYSINENVRIVTAPRQWRTYLERGWGTVEKPPEILRPKDDAERKIWRELSEKGWSEGRAQADDVFEQDLNRLTADFEGMVRYRQLLAQGMVSQPFALQIDRGVTGVATAATGASGQKVPITSTMRVGDRAVVITGVPELITGSDQWRPASR